MAKNYSGSDTPGDDLGISLGQKADGPGKGLSKGANSDKNVYGYKGARRDDQGGKTSTVGTYVGHFADGDRGGEYKLTSNWNPLDDLVKGPLASGDFKQPKFTDFAGGISAPQPRKDMLRYQSDPGFKPDVPSKREIQKGFRSRENDWRGDE